MRFDRERVRKNAQQASTEDLLDRVTVYRSGMESEALAVLEAELRQRGVGQLQIEQHAAAHGPAALAAEDLTLRCSFCDRPAVAQGWGWHRVWGVLPLFPRWFHYCASHQPAPRTESA